MRLKDTTDVHVSLIAVVADGIAVGVGFCLAVWIRFDSGWLRVPFGRPHNLYELYLPLILVATVLFLFVYKSLALYVRPQGGTFSDKVPRLIRATGTGIVLATVLAFGATNYYAIKVSTAVLGLSFVLVSVLVLIERRILYDLEIRSARRSRAMQKVLILGTDSMAVRMEQALTNDPRLRSEVVGFFSLPDEEPDPAISADRKIGDLEVLHNWLKPGAVSKVILTNSGIGNRRIVDLIMLCEKNMTTFNMVPDLFTLMAGNVDIQSVEDIPVLGIKPWPLDNFWNRILKRAEDIFGALVGLLLAAPVVAIAAVLIRRSSAGPIFYKQERCGENGQRFTLYKLRTMPVDSEASSGPVWTVESDPRRTRIGAFLRSYNLDELPQLWNVLTGEMSLVGPRPERPHFVEQFREDIQSYMWRHVSKPGMTGWAQVNGLRGNTSITERIKFDLYYLENWSFSFDFKIILRTFFTRSNAY